MKLSTHVTTYRHPQRSCLYMANEDVYTCHHLQTQIPTDLSSLVEINLESLSCTRPPHPPEKTKLSACQGGSWNPAHLQDPDQLCFLGGEGGVFFTNFPG